MSNKLQQQVPALQITCSCCEYGGIAILLHIDYYTSDYWDGYIAYYNIGDYHIADHYIVTLGHIDYYIADYCDGYIADYYIDDFHIADHYIVTIGHIDYYISDYCDGIYSWL